MNLDEERERLSQAAHLAWLRRDLKATDMVTVDLSHEHRLQLHFIHQCALIPQDLVNLELSKATLEETRLYGGVPAAFSPTWGSGGQVEYFRYGVENGVEPLIINRDFHRVREGYEEISEEFRHFHRLYHDRKTEKYIKIDDAGNEEVVAVVQSNQIDVRLKELRQFLAVKEMYLSIRFDFTDYSDYTLKVLGIESNLQGCFKRDGLVCWTHGYKDIDFGLRKSMSWLMGKRLIKPLPKSKSGFGDFAVQDREYVEFIFDVDDNGDPICYTCDPEHLDLPARNPDAPFYLTPIHFSKKVLNKYYNEPGKYAVRDSGVSCGSLWSVKIDNHAPDKVCVMFRDLSHLPYTEQLHWRVHNIPPEGGVSETFFRRNVQGEWASSDQPDLLFKQHYELLRRACDECLGWQLLKPLGSGDAYRLQRIRVPATDDQSQFDDLVGDLQTVLIESLNVKPLKKLLLPAAREQLKGKGSIALLREVLISHEVEESKVAFLGKLQGLRSKGSSHLKGTGYQKIAAHFGVDSRGQKEAFSGILWQAINVLEFLTDLVHSGKLNDKNGKNS